MTAGKGIVHAEMPGSFDVSSRGFQLWINLASQNKFCDPQYQEYKRNLIPEYDSYEGLKIKVIAGDAFGVKGPIIARTEAIYLDIQFSKAD